MPKREDEFWAGRKEPQGRALCPFCGSSNISYNKRFESWRCNKCEKSFPTPSYGPGGDFGKEARWFGKTTADIRRKESSEAAKEGIRRRRYRNTVISRALPSWVAPGIIIFVFLIFGIVIWGYWGNQIAYFFDSLSRAPQAVVSQTPPESPPAEGSTPAPTPTPAPAEPPESVKTEVSYTNEEVEEFIYVLINNERLSFGLNPLRKDTLLTSLAREHSISMVKHEFFSHDRATEEKDFMYGQPPGAIRGENISETPQRKWVPGPYLTLEEVCEWIVSDWMDSMGHRENILEPTFSKTGVGVSRSGEFLYITQMFEGAY